MNPLEPETRAEVARWLLGTRDAFLRDVELAKASELFVVETTEDTTCAVFTGDAGEWRATLKKGSFVALAFAGKDGDAVEWTPDELALLNILLPGAVSGLRITATVRRMVARHRAGQKD